MGLRGLGDLVVWGWGLGGLAVVGAILRPAVLTTRLNRKADALNPNVRNYLPSGRR